MRQVFEKIRKSITAGALVGTAAYLFLRSEKPFGALLFGFALCFVCLCNLDLFTGRIGWFGVKDFPYLRILIGNAIGAVAVSLLLRQNTAIIETAQAVVSTKAALPWHVALINGIFCGVLMYLAVLGWSRGIKSACFVCVSVFIFCGFEHSIADMAYMALAGQWMWNLIWILLGNGIGAVVCRMMIMDGEDAKFRLHLSRNK